jgi:CHAT domain-containing protein
MRGFRLNVLVWIIILSSVGVLNSQNSTKSQLTLIDNLLAAKNYSEAKIFTKNCVDSLFANEQFYEATDFVYYLGQIDLNINGKTSSIDAIKSFSNKLESLTKDKKVLRQLALETGSFYESIGDSETAKNFNLKALEITKEMPTATGKDFALIQSNIGVFYSRLGDITKAAQFHKKALNSLESDSSSEPDSYYITYNSLGAMMWYTSKFDSAVYYYKKAEKTLNSLEPTPWNKFYRSASLNNNIAGIYSIQGNLEASVKAMQTTVNNLSAYLKENVSDSRRTYAREFLFQAIDNYAGLYKEIGDYKRAKELISYAYEQKKLFLDPDSPEIAKGKVLLGEINSALRNYESANELLNEGIDNFKAMPGEYDYWLADAYAHKAMVEKESGNMQIAKSYYLESENYYKKALGNYYDEIYLGFIVTASNFYAEIGEKDKAIDMASEALSYIENNQGEKTLIEYFQIVNLADIRYQFKDYEEALNLCNEALNLINSNTLAENSQLNSLQIEGHKVSALLLKVKINLRQNRNKDESFLKSQLSEINEVIKLLEEKKSIISSDASTAILIQDNSDVFLLAKTLNLELYKLTKSDKYLESLLGFHESMIYHKIRNRLNSQSVALTANLPDEILEKEKDLKSQLNSFLEDKTEFNAFLKNEEKWYTFLDELKRNYPDYYKLRYASISKSLNDIKSKIPEYSTLIRYLFIDKQLFAFVITASDINMIKLDASNLVSNLNQLNSKINLIEPSLNLQNTLYEQLWQPLESHILTEHIIIVPDKELFNLSFELLTFIPCNSYDELKSHSLMAKHIISYNYSLFLIDKDSQPIGYDSNFIAFAPEFSDDMKTNYKVAIKDSLELDYTYLKLLPQPFAKDLASTYSKIFKGNSFLNEKATKTIFTNSAREHKIIHIGTHAESDNISPEFSRLIFAKNTEDDNNSLYTFEIYNENLASNLAILTACETGKPLYQPGEGMISLAHAFNYAGSESILTSLWKIDEQSSAEILEYFYDNISTGLTKDAALRQAKLDYIANAEGRTIAPQYWAGLVLIGDTSPINLNTSISWWIWVLSILVVLIIVYQIFKKKRIKI